MDGCSRFLRFAHELEAQQPPQKPHLSAWGLGSLPPPQPPPLRTPCSRSSGRFQNPAAIGAPEAWTQSTGKGVLVAILDTGVQLDHPDLAGAIWTNPGEVAGNGRDDDSNGFVDDVHGANMFDSSANVDDDNGHGTHVAGDRRRAPGQRHRRLRRRARGDDPAGQGARRQHVGHDRHARPRHPLRRRQGREDPQHLREHRRRDRDDPGRREVRRRARRGRRRLGRQQRPQHRPAAVLRRVADRPRGHDRRRAELAPTSSGRSRTRACCRPTSPPRACRSSPRRAARPTSRAPAPRPRRRSSQARSRCWQRRARISR